MRQKTFGKWLAAAGILIVMTIWMVLPALAAPTVNSIRITFKDKYEDPGVIEEPEISCSSYGIEITSVEWSKDVEKWNPGTKVTATLILSSSGREFSSSYGSKSCQISGATLSKAVKVDDDLKVTVTYYPVVWLESPDEAGWSASNHMKAVWKKVDYATGYQIRLYRDDYYNEDSEKRNIAECIVAKNRHGETGRETTIMRSARWERQRTMRSTARAVIILPLLTDIWMTLATQKAAGRITRMERSMWTRMARS